MLKFSARPGIDASDHNLALCDYAAAVLKEAGFVLVYTSMKSEACYYRLGDREGVLRIAAHRFGCTEQRALTMPVWSALTFPQNGPRSMDALKSQIESAVGRYVLYPLTKTSRFSQRLDQVTSLWVDG